VTSTESFGHNELHDQPVGQLLKQLANETTTLVKLELDLAKSEVRETTRKAVPAIAMLAAGGLVAVLALGALTAFLILALDGVMPNWVAALIITAVYAAAAAALFLVGKKRLAEAGTPAPQTIETLKEDVEWAKHPTTSASR